MVSLDHLIRPSMVNGDGVASQSGNGDGGQSDPKIVNGDGGEIPSLSNHMYKLV